MLSGTNCIPCYYCKDEEEPVPLYDSKSFAAHILESHRDQVGPVIVPDQVVPVIVPDPVDLILGDSFELNKLFVEDEDASASASASAADSAGTIACDFCTETFKDLSSSTSHIRISHPDLFYPVSASAAVFGSASASAAAFGSDSAPAAAFGSDSASASALASAAAFGSDSASADAEVSDDTNKEWGDSYLWSFDI